jgi:hypothetical protein
MGGRGVSCAHPSGTITDHAVQETSEQTVRYAWRGACNGCQRGVVGVSALPAGLSSERLLSLLNSELAAYLATVATAHA